ncbi:MAG TPA: dihydropteroate synthase, partial [Microthrixaceae bacterium]|nr:dihydropteroate synthase [Microthrixaceae bacterium]
MSPPPPVRMRRPSVFAVLNASPESFSGNRVAADDAADLAEAMVADGADVLDIGAQSLRTDQPELPVSASPRWRSSSGCIVAQSGRRL